MTRYKFFWGFFWKKRNLFIFSLSILVRNQIVSVFQSTLFKFISDPELLGSGMIVSGLGYCLNFWIYPDPQHCFIDPDTRPCLNLDPIRIQAQLTLCFARKAVLNEHWFLVCTYSILLIIFSGLTAFKKWLSYDNHPWNTCEFCSYCVHSQEYCNDEKASDIHLEFMKAIDACQVKYIPEKVKILDSSWMFYSIFLYTYNIMEKCR